jgi:DNA polymerase-1
MIIQVHDELLFEVDSKLILEISDSFAKIMKEIIKLKIPVLVDSELGDNWGELKKIKTY